MADPADPAGDHESPPAQTPRLVVVDADERTRESIVGILGIRHRYEVVGSAGHVGAALTLVAQLEPDVVVVDPRLPDVPDGIAFIRRIRASHPHACILAVGLSPALELDTVVAGADGFVRKTFRPGDLSGAITRCLALHRHEGDVGAGEHDRGSSMRSTGEPASPPRPAASPATSSATTAAEPLPRDGLGTPAPVRAPGLVL